MRNGNRCNSIQVNLEKSPFEVRSVASLARYSSAMRKPSHVCSFHMFVLIVAFAIRISAFTSVEYMPKRAGSSNDAVAPAKEARFSGELGRAVAAHSHTTKTAAVKLLTTLQQHGIVDVNVSERQLRKDIHNCSEEHAKQVTDYGPIIQRVHLGHPKMKYWEVCHPFAFLWYLTSISSSFAQIMKTAIDGGNPLRLVIYMDEMNPGNPFRPEKSRTMQCIYWCFVDWPAWMLTRTFAWPCLSVIRSTIVESIEGGMSFFVKPILNLFFPEEGHSFARGVQVVYKGTMVLTKSIFAGFLCDLKGHKENTGWLGYNGLVCCLNCENLRKNTRGQHTHVIGLDCSDRSRFVSRTNEDVWAIIDELKDAKPRLRPTPFKQLETDRGFHYVPNGVLGDPSMRRIYRPMDHTLRDWMHTLTGDGQANTTIGETLHAIRPHGLSNDRLIQFMMLVHVPHKTPKPCADWLKACRIKEHTITSFSGVVLTLVPIIYMFLEEFCKNVPALKEIFECFQTLWYIIGLLQSGPDRSVQFKDKLCELFQLHHAQFVKLYTGLKPKLHHMHHIIDHMEWVGKLLSCFVTERKHRVIKDIALHVFRNLEHTVIHDVVNQQIEQMIHGVDIFKEMFLVSPHTINGDDGTAAQSSKKAVLPCGLVRAGDIVMFRDSSCGRVLKFWELQGAMFVSVDEFEIVGGDVSRLAEDRSSLKFQAAEDLVEPLLYFYPAPNVINVACHHK